MKDNNEQAKELSEALLVHGVTTGWSTGDCLSQDTTDTLLTALSLDGKDPLEVALVSQMLACHCQSVQMMGKASKAPHIDSAASYIKLATQLMSLYAKQTEVLMKYRLKDRLKDRDHTKE